MPGLFSPPTFANSGGITTKPLTSTMPVTANPSLDIYKAQQDLAQKKRALIDLSNPSGALQSASTAASRGAIELTNPSNPLRSASTNAKRSLLDATGVQSGQQRSYYNTLGGIINQRTGETQHLIDASHDVADLSAVAQAKGHDRAVNALRDSIGMARPIEIDTPQNDTTPLPVGVARSRRTNAEYVDQANKEAEAGRTNTLAALRNNLDLGELDVGDVRRQGQYADLALNTAEQGAGYQSKVANQALQNAQDEAGYQQNVSASNVSQLGTAPYGKVLYQDPQTGASRYVTPAEKDDLDYQYQNARGLQRIPSQYAATQARTQYATQQQGQGSQLAALSEVQLLNTLPNNANAFNNQAVLQELMRRYKLDGYDDEAAARAAFARIEQELATRKKTSSTVFGTPAPASSTAAPGAPGTAAPFTFGP